MPISKFHCPECRHSLIAAAAGGLVCEHCGAPVAVVDGVLDFVRGRTDTQLDPNDYDSFHRIDDAASNARYRGIKQLAGERWPVALGSVLEVGCGTGLLSRALIRGNEARDLVLTDVSLPMLQTTRKHLDLAGLLSAMPMTLATYSGTEACFRDVCFDTCVGTSVLHHIVDVRQFLADMFHWMKPGGRAFFMEPNLRFHRAVAQTLADILVLMNRQEPGFSGGKQELLNLIAQWRRGILHQGDLPFLATLEDKHMFASDAFEAMGRELGFSAVTAIPTGWQPTGYGLVNGLCSQLGIEDPVRGAVLGLLPAFADRYLAMLSPRDQSDGFLFWLEKGVGPVMRQFRALPPPESPLPTSLPEGLQTGGLPPHWSLELTASRTPEGIALHVKGWCLINAAVLWVRITLGGVVRQTPVWLPRPDVHEALNASGLYASWNALCCGVDETLHFGDVELDLGLEVVLANRTPLATSAPAKLILDEMAVVSR